MQGERRSGQPPGDVMKEENHRKKGDKYPAPPPPPVEKGGQKGGDDQQDGQQAADHPDQHRPSGMTKRSEERRVGKECRSRWAREHEKKEDRKDKSRCTR